MAYLKNPEEHKLDEFRDKTIHQHNGKYYVRCCLCSVRVKPGQLNMDYRVCDYCDEIDQKYSIVGMADGNNHRAKRKKSENLEATLTPLQWFRCLEYFDFSCAYCGDIFQTLEHLIPISKGGGTTVYNSLPSCRKCNRKKGLKTHFPNLSEEHAAKIKAYFALPDLENPPYRITPMKIAEILEMSDRLPPTFV